MMLGASARGNQIKNNVRAGLVPAHSLLPIQYFPTQVINIFLLCSFLLIIFELNLFAKTPQTITGTLIGQVFDENKTPLKGVRVEIKNIDNGFPYAELTNEQGFYEFDLVPAGEYDITVEKEGYITVILPKYPVDVSTKKTVKPPPVQLFPVTVTPPIQQTPSIRTSSAQANIYDSTLRGNFTSDFILALPLREIRSFDVLALLVAGVSPAPITFGTTGVGLGNGVGTAGQFSVNGNRARSNNFTIDGSDNNDQDVGVRRQGFTSVIPQTIESIREFQITTLLADAESGRNVGGQVNVISNTGTSLIHGNVYDFFNDSSLNARDFFDLQIPSSSLSSKPSLTRNQIGGALSFPILKEKLTVFSAFERQDINRSQFFHFAVPTIFQRNRAIQRGDKFSPSLLLSPGRSIFKLFPLPNNAGGPYGVNTLSQLLAANSNGNVFSIKMDYRFNPFDKVSTFSSRYNFTDDNAQIPVIDNAINSSVISKTRTQNLALALNTTVSNKISNQIRFSYGRTSLRFLETKSSPFLFQSEPDFDRVGNDGIADSPTGAIGRLVMSPFSSVGVDPFTFPQQRANNVFQIADTVVLTANRNTLKFGFDIRRVQFNSRLERNYRAQLTYNSNVIASNSAIVGSGADFVGLDVPSDIFQALAITPDATLGLRFTEANLFANTNFQPTTRIRIDLGLRYELNTVPTDVNKRIEKTLALTSDVVSSGQTDILTQRFLSTFNAQRQFLAGREKIYQADKNNFAPRIGIAINLTNDGKTSIRSGYGLFYDQILGNVVSQSRNVFPTFISTNFGAGIFAANIIGKNPAFLMVQAPNGNFQPLLQPNSINTINFPQSQIAPLLGSFLVNDILSFGFTLPTKNLLTPYVHQYSITLEKAFLNNYEASIAYVGTQGHKLLRFRTPNGGASTPLFFDVNTGVTAINRARPIPQLGAFTVFESSANSNYNALQLSLVRRSAKEFNFRLAYTYSHTIDEVSDLFDVAGGFALAQDETSLNKGLKAEKGSANFDVRHRFTTSFQYKFPAFAKHKFLNGVDLSGILTLQTGQPYTINSRLDVNRDGNLTDRLDTTNGLVFSEGLTKIKITPGISEFSFLAQNSSSGAVGRNSFRTAGIASLDLALDKNLTIKSTQTLKLRLEIFNIFNRTHFGVPGRVLGAPGFGSSVNTSLPARIVQLAIKYNF